MSVNEIRDEIRAFDIYEPVSPQSSTWANWKQHLLPSVEMEMMCKTDKGILWRGLCFNRYGAPRKHHGSMGCSLPGVLLRSYFSDKPGQMPSGALIIQWLLICSLTDWWLISFMQPTNTEHLCRLDTGETEMNIKPVFTLTIIQDPWEVAEQTVPPGHPRGVCSELWAPRGGSTPEGQETCQRRKRLGLLQLMCSSSLQNSPSSLWCCHHYNVRTVSDFLSTHRS